MSFTPADTLTIVLGALGLLAVITGGAIVLLGFMGPRAPRKARPPEHSNPPHPQPGG